MPDSDVFRETMDVIAVTGESLPEAWENAVRLTWEHGREIATQYDKPEDPPSKDTMAVITVSDPMAEPRIHKCFPGGILELETYRQEVVDGIHDHWIDPEAGKWQYSYHERIRRYTVPGLDEPIDQLAYVIDQLRKCPYTRRAVISLWKPWEDAGIGDPACLNHMAFRIVDGKLYLKVYMRSNDAYKAAFMNMYAFTSLQAKVATEVGVEVGPYIHTAASFHIYGSYFAEFSGFLKALRERTFAQRTWRTDDSLVAEMMAEAREQVAASIERERETGRKGL
jgi:thymidylate synthase